jgi:hypothetical protein
MKLWGLAVLAAGAVAANFQTSKPQNEYVIFLSGDAQGYLSPCGCSAPMIGGTKRRATAIQKLGIPKRTLLLENGGLVKEAGRQDEIKLETFAQLHSASHGAILNLTPSEAALGPGAIHSMARLSNGRLVSASIQNPEEFGLKAYRTEGPFLIGGVTARPEQAATGLGAASLPLESSVANLVKAASRSKKSLILVLDGTRELAQSLARQFPQIALIQYRVSGRPRDKSERVGNVLLASPGDGGRYLVRLVWRANRFVSYVPVELEPSYSDHPGAAKTYKTYLNRISDEKLLEALPRVQTEKYAGSSSCGSCHAESDRVWRHSKHFIALKTLEKVGHDRDPDCVECHVVGLASIYGFKSRKETPDLGHVGCESCHGPGNAHIEQPSLNQMGTVGEKSCIPCHNVENSPRFDFATYWAKIKHK